MWHLLFAGMLTFAFAFLLHRLLSGKKGQGVYSQPGLWFIYWPRWVRYCVILGFKQLYCPKRLNNYDPHENTYETSGIVPTPSEIELEKPKTLITTRHDDGMFFWGGDKDGRCIVAKVVRLSNRCGSVILLVRDENGNIYTLPNHPDGNVINADNEYHWQGNGLLLECVEPMRTWRVKFNGFMRKGIRNKYVTEDDEDDDDGDFEIKNKNQHHIVEARLDFIWNAMRAPVDIWRDNSCRLLAYALARESSADSSAFKALQRDGYDQWGALHGSIQINYEKEHFWYLRGGRQHRWGMSDSTTNLYRSVNFFSYFDGGDIAWIEAFSFKTWISHCVIGYMQSSSGRYLPITSTALELSEVGENGEIPKNIFLEFTVGGKKIHLWHCMSDASLLVHSGDPWTLQHNFIPTHTASSRHGNGWGLAILSRRFSGLCPVPEREKLQIPKFLGTPSKFPLVLPFVDEHCALLSLTGGKGSSLACLAYIASKNHNDKNFSVPVGVVITSAAWMLQMKESPELSNAIKCLEKSVTSSQFIQMQEACSRLQNIMKSVKVHDAIATCLQQHLESLFSDNIHKKRFAVRSSGCCEDSSDSSSAGQNESFLGCSWEPDDELQNKSVLKALTACWGSQFTFQSVEYRRQRGQPLNDGMAVVVQEMVSADSAGVMFTRDPVTGGPANIVISANYGLGESVVSASSEPDTLTVQRTWRNKLRIGGRKLGEKKKKYIMKGHGGTEEVDVSEKDQRELCVSDELAIRLARIGIYLEDSYGSPRDIEFAISENNIYVLQSRPITSLNQWTDYELIHENGTTFITEQEFLTVANTGEVFPGYICPLTISTVVKNLDLGLQRDFIHREWPKYKFDPTTVRNMAVFNSNCFLNMYEVAYRGNEDHITMVNHAVDLSIFGRICTTPDIHKWAVNRYGVMSTFAKVVRNGYAFYDMFINSRRVSKLQSAFNIEIDTKRVQSSISLYKEICRRLPESIKFFETHSHTSAASTMTQCIALVTMADSKHEISLDMIQDMASLLSCISSTESADVPVSLKKLAKTIAMNEELDDFLLMSADEGRVWLESHPESVGHVYRSFISKHGHRCIKEFDLRALSWGIAPEGLVTTLQTMVRNPSSYEKLKEIQNLDLILDSMINKLTNSKKRALKFIIGLCGKSISLREATKSMVIKTVDAFRSAYRTLGLLMVSECRLPDADLIFFLNHREIGLLLETRSAILVSKAIKRKRLMKQLENYRYDEISFGIPQPINLKDKTSYSIIDTDVKLMGTPVCHGQSTGFARVITHLDEALSIQNGDILVTYCTDIGWTPYFPLLSGVITEIGGLISHGAVVAREYGLPCVVGVKGATNAFSSGDLIFLDGKEGFVKKLKK